MFGDRIAVQYGIVNREEWIKMKTNLWNVTKKKTKAVIEYIEALPEPSNATHCVVQFDRLKEEALFEITPDAMLIDIGYNYKGKEGIYTRCLRRN